MRIAPPWSTSRPDCKVIIERAEADDSGLLDRILGSLPLIADISHADLLVYVPVAGDAVVVGHAQPHPVPSLYPSSQVGTVTHRAEASPLFRVLERGRDHQSVSGTLVCGAPTVQDVFPLRDSARRVIGAVAIHTNLLEYERLQGRDALYREMVARVRERAFSGQLFGSAALGRLTEHDGVLIVDKRGIIRYMNSVAENQYRRLGYVDSLLGEQIAYLETNEYICFRAIERAVCLELRIQELDQVWIKRAVPILPATSPRPTLFGRVGPPPSEPEGAVLFIQDITDDVRREQELKVKSAMIQEVHHRVKNNLQTLAFLLRMEARRATASETQDVLRQMIGRVLSIAFVHEFLSRGEMSEISIRDVCSRIVGEVTGGMFNPEKQVRIDVAGESFSLPAQQATSCALVMNELIQNAVEHGFAGRDVGSIRVRFRQLDSSMVIEISDDGVGLPEGFELERSSSLGLEIVKTLVMDDLRGQFLLESGQGVTARISFPKELCRAA